MPQLAPPPLVLPWILALLAPPGVAQELVTHFPGEEPLGWYGLSIALVGDLDGDGLSDFAAGAPGEDDRGPGSGCVRVQSGATGKLLYLVPGEAPKDAFGRSIVALDDVDGDGYRDWAASAPGVYPMPGRVTAHSGRSGEELFRVENDVDQFALGYALCPAGDLDGDDLRDFVASRLRRDAQGSWQDEQCVFSGRDGNLLRVFPNESQQWRIATACGLGDLDQDGVVDFALGYLYHPPTPGNTAWKVDLVSGASGSVLRTMSQPTTGLGLLVRPLGDLDGDGLEELAVSIQYTHVWTYSTADGSLLHTILPRSGNERVGFNLMPTGDLTGDGVGDLAIENYLAIGAFPTSYGPTKVGIHSGADGALVSEFEVSPDRVNHYSYQGTALAGAEDLDGDGSVDLLVGFPGAEYHVGWQPPPQGEVRFHSLGSKGLRADRNHLILGQPGEQYLTLQAGVQYAGLPFLMLGSAGGTQPPTPFKGSLVPLVAGPYFHFTATHPGEAPLLVQQPVINEYGIGKAAYRWDGSTDPFWLGVTLHHAALVLDPSGHHLVSNPVPLVFQLDPCAVENPWVLDCNANGNADDCDVRNGTSQDCNANGVPDECDIASGDSGDCDFNGVPDECDADCNGNGVADACDIASGTSDDCNGNGIPDECSWLETDCNGNGLPDACDIAFGLSNDCNGNGIPDDCIWKEVDCNANGVPDSCDLAAGTSFDCNENGIPDECPQEIDLNANGIPDECEPELRWYVDDDAPADPGPGDPTLSDPLEDGSPEHPFDSIQEAVSASTSHNVILLAEGLYSGPGNFDLDLTGRVLAFVGPGAETCVIDAGGLGGAFRGVLRGSVFQGLTIRNTSTTAIWTSEGPVTIRACGFEDCTQAVFLRSIPPSIEVPNLVENCTFSGSLSSACYIAGTTLVRNSSFVRNQSSDKGGALYIGAPSVVQGCTFFENTAVKGGAIWGEQFELENSILWGNTAPKGAQIKVATSMVVTHCDVQGGQAAVSANVGSTVTWGPGNLDVDPAFVDPAAADVHLAPGSPCIDQGDPSFEMEGQTDIDGEPRVMNGRVDMGADEVPFGTPGG